jgi:hypothetical protein
MIALQSLLAKLVDTLPNAAPLAELIRVANSYFEGMGTDKKTPLDKDCQRIEERRWPSHGPMAPMSDQSD